MVCIVVVFDCGLNSDFSQTDFGGKRLQLVGKFVHGELSVPSDTTEQLKHFMRSTQDNGLVSTVKL